GTAGTYMVTVEDCNGCIATDEVVLDVDDTEITTNESTNKEICDGESVTFTVQTNATNPPYTDIEFIRFGSMVADPYSASGGTFLGEFDLTATSGSITTSDFPNTDPKKNETYFVYACVKPAPADGFCKPFVKYTVVVEDNPNVSFSKVNPDCDETTGTITFTYTPHDNRGNIEFQLEQNGSIVEAYSDNNVGDGSSSYSITGLAPGTYDVSARWGNDECEVDLGQTVIEPVPVVCDVPEICVEGIVVDFDTAPDGTPLVSGTTDIEAEQPYANIFGAGSGVMFSTNDPTNKPLNLYDSEDPIGLDPDLERNDDGDGFWEAGNLANQPLFNLLIINQTSDLSQPNDNSGGGMIMSSANQFLDAFSFDVVDLDDAEMGDAEIVFENTVTGETATLNLDVFEDVASNTSPFKVLGVTYIERSANRISDITAEELGISSFNKITFNLNNGVTLGIGSICFKLAELGAIGNYVWVDEDSNGLQDAGEPGIPNVKVNLFYDTDGSGGLNGGETTPIATTFTDAQGGYLFPDLPQGMYFVKVDDSTIPTGMTQTTIFTNVVDGSDADTDPDDGDLGNKDQSGDGYKITLDTGEENLTADFGYNYNPTDDVNDDEDLAAIGDRVWIDSDGDGVQDPNEIGVEGVEVTLTGAGDDGIFGTGDDVTATTTTDENGYYLFDDLVPGAYMTEVTDDAGATYEVLNTTNYDQTGDPDDFGEPASDPDNKLTDAVLLGPGDVFLNADYGYQPTDANNLLSAIGDFVWFDADKDGNGPSLESPEEGGGAIVQGGNTGTADPEEYGIEGVSVALIRDENANGVWDDGEPIIATDVTDENGFYYFPDLIQTGGTGTDDYLVWVNDTDNVLDDLRPTFDKDGGSVPFETGAPIGEDADGVLGISAVTNLGTSAAPGASRLMQDFGYAPRTNSSGDGLIGDYVWFDDNRDGVQDPDEEGIEGVVVELYDLGADDMVGGGDDVLIATAITDENGYYYFGGLSLDDEEGDNDFAYQVIIADENFDPGKPLQGFENTADPDSGTASPDNEGGEVVLNGGNTQDLDQDFGYAGQNDATPVGSIGDTVFEDKDADGVRDEGEEGIAGVTIDLYRDLNGNGELDPGEPKIATETTDENGMYLFTDLPINDQGGDNDADYIVDVTDVDGILIGYWHSTSPNQDATTNGGDDDTAMDDTGDNSKEDAFAVAIDATIPNNRNVDFGYYKDLAALGNYVWLDTNKNGLQDDGETGINDVEVKLTIEYPNGDMVTVVTTTEDDADGNPGFYDFPNLLADEDYNMGSMGAPTSLPQFTISVDENQTAFTLANLSPTLTDVNANGNDLEDSDDFDGVVAKPIQGEEDTSAKDPATDEEVIASYDFGVQKNLLGAIGNYVWLDENSDGFQDAGEPGIPNVKVDLKDEDGNVIATAFTDSDGGYLFPDLPTGMYFVDVDESTLPDTDGNPMTQDLTQTTVFTNSGDNVPSDDVDEGDFGNKDQSAGDGYKVTLDEGEENLTADFGYNYNPTDDVDDGENTAALGDRVWIDSDGDGAQDPEEIGVEGVEVTLTGAGDDGIFGTADDVTATTTTDENGFYLFDDLEPGAYMVEVTEDAGASHDILDDNAYDQTGDPDDFGMLATNPDDKTTTPVILAPGDVFLNADFGYQPDDNTPLGSIGNTVWLDADADGNGPADVNGDTSNGAGVEDDDNEEPIEGVTVVLVKDEDGDGIWDEGEPIIATDVTDENGQYLFEDLPIDDGAGTDDYIVAVTDTDNILSGLKGTYDDDGGMDELGSLFPTTGDPTDPSQVLGVSAVTDLDATPVTDQDFGYTPETQDDGEGLIGDYVWFDENGDGVQDPEEEGIEGVVVELYDPGADMVPGGGDDVLLATTTTDENGYYYFGGLDADDDKYYVKVSDENFDPNGVLEGMENTEDPDGDDDSEGGTVTLTNADPIDLDQDFGYRAPMNADGTIGTLVWEDVNADGNRDAGEEGFEGVTVDLYRDLNSNGLIDAGEPIFASTATDMNGDYLFENLPFGDYIV
ncbi:MAG: SdrD B-like domain-containing protein, partial [Bacteroidota bacterium]